MTYEARWDECARQIEAADEAEDLLDDLARAYGPDGTRGIVVSFGLKERPQLEVAINPDEGRACLRWLDEPAQYAAEEDLPDHPRPIHVWSYRSEGKRLLPALHTRVTPGAALQALRTYINTGTRPTGLSWHAA